MFYARILASVLILLLMFLDVQPVGSVGLCGVFRTWNT